MARKLIVEIVGDASSLSKSLRKAETSTQGFAKKSVGIGKSLAKAGIFAGAAAGVGALVTATKIGVDEFVEAQKVGAQTRAVLESTGGAANVTASHIDSLAGSIMKYSGIDDEAVKSGENLLLTFTNVRNEVGKGNDIFDQATKTVTDMSVALGQDMKTSAIQLGKALNDPVKGVGALRRVGVAFDAQQIKLIKTLTASGKTMQAQKVILAELRKEFGGSAKAAGQTLAGRLNVLRETFANLAGQIVTMVIPAFTKLVDRAVKWITNVQNQRKVMQTAREVFNSIVHVIRILQRVFDALSKIVGSNTNAIKLLIVAYATFKGLRLASTVAGIATSFMGLRTATVATTTATRGLTAAMLGRAGLVGAVGLLSFGLTTAVLKATGLDQKFKDLGGSAYDFAAKLGLVNDQMKQYEGKVTPTGATAVAIKGETQRLIAGGATVGQAVTRVGATHPGMATHDIQVLVRHFAEAYAKRAAGPTINIEHFHSAAQNPRELQDALTKTHRGRPVRRRGDP